MSARLVIKLRCEERQLQWPWEHRLRLKRKASSDGETVVHRKGRTGDHWECHQQGAHNIQCGEEEVRNFGQHAERDVINRKVRFNVEGYNVFVLVVRGDCFKNKEDRLS